MIRRASPTDALAIVELAARAVSGLPDSRNVVSSAARVRQAAKRLISDPQSLVLVCDQDGKLNGVLAMSVSDALWFERKVAGIVLWYAETPRTGYAMLRQALTWAKGRPAIKAVGFSEEFAVDQRVGNLLMRAGLPRRGAVYARY